MDKTYVRINWENEPSMATPIGATNLNKIDYAVNEIDNRVITLDTGKASQTDELLDIKTVAYNSTTGVWTFTHQNGTVDTFDQNIEKIPVSFSMDANGVITMTTADGTQYTCDVSTLIKTYTFSNTSTIQFTTTTDASGNKTVTANVIDGSITRAKLDPDYLAQIDLDVASASSSANSASSSASTSTTQALKSEGFAVGQQNGTDVASDSPYYWNNAKYYSESADNSASSAATSAADAHMSEINASASATSASSGADASNISALKSEGFAIGSQNGVIVGSSSPYYENNSKYFSQQASTSASNASTSENNALSYKNDASASATAASGSATSASGSATTASNKALDSEAYAIGTRGGVPVTSDDPAYENNSKYYAEQSGSLGNLADVGITNPEEGDVITYNSETEKWENKQGAIGNTSDDIPYLSRETNNGNRVGSKRVVKDLVGGSVVANQLANPQSYSEGGLTVTVNNGRVTINGSKPTTTYLKLNDNYLTIENHIYFLCSGDYIIYGNTRIYNDGGGLDIPNGANYAIQRATLNKYLYLRIAGIDTFDNVSLVPQVIDLTTMFGTTVADALYSMEQATAGSGVALFRQLFPNDYYAYQTAELVSVKPSAMVSGGKTYPISEVDLRGLLSISNGKWVYDGDIRTCGGEITRKYGIVDLGSLNWFKTSFTNTTFQATTGTAKPKVTGTGASQLATGIIINANYTVNTLSVVRYGDMNKIFTIFDDSGTYISVRDDSYTDATTFKTAMDGVYLIYELATPTTEYVPAFSEIQDATENGTESFTDARTFPMPVAHHTDYPYGEISDIIFDVPNTREQQNITNRLGDLSKAIAEQNLEKYGYKIGDYFERTDGQRTYIYILADMDTFYGGYVRNAVVNTHHISIIVNTGANIEWLASGETFAGYNGSTLHTYLSGDVLDNIKADMIALFGGTTGLEHLISHSNLLSTSVSASDWFVNTICALSECQIYGCNFWSKSNTVTEAYKKLELFNKYNINLMFGDNLVWLRDFKDNDTVNACSIYRNGSTAYDSVTNSRLAVGLILLK